MKLYIVRWLVACTVILLLSGCVSTPRYTYGIASAHFPEISSGQGRIYFYRWKEAVINGEGVNTVISINDQSLGTLRSHCFYFVDRPAGEYFVKCRTGLLDPKQGERKLIFILKPGETKYIRVTEHWGPITADAVPTLEDKDSAISALQLCIYTPCNK